MARTNTKSVSIFEKGNIVFLTKFGLHNTPEIILEIEDYNTDLGVIMSSKVLTIEKDIKREEDTISLIPLGNAFVFSSINSDGDTPVTGYMCFKVSNFDMFGTVENSEILSIFNKSFSTVNENANVKMPKVKKSKGIVL